MDNREFNNYLDDPAFQPAGYEGYSDTGNMQFDPMPASLEGMPGNRRYSWDEDLQILRNQFPFMQIDPPIGTTFKFHMNAATQTPVYVNIPPNAVMMRITFFSNNTNTSVAMSLAELDNTTEIRENAQTIINPSNAWRYCKHISQVVIWPVSMSGAGLVRGTIEFFQQF